MLLSKEILFGDSKSGTKNTNCPKPCMTVTNDSKLIHASNRSNVDDNNVNSSTSPSSTTVDLAKLENDITVLHQENAYLARRLHKLESPKS